MLIFWRLYRKSRRNNIAGNTYERARSSERSFPGTIFLFRAYPAITLSWSCGLRGTFGPCRAQAFGKHSLPVLNSYPIEINSPFLPSNINPRVSPRRFVPAPLFPFAFPTVFRPTSLVMARVVPSSSSHSWISNHQPAAVVPIVHSCLCACYYYTYILLFVLNINVYWNRVRSRTKKIK